MNEAAWREPVSGVGGRGRGGGLRGALVGVGGGGDIGGPLLAAGGVRGAGDVPAVSRGDEGSIPGCA